jgi:hypothetical protein
MVSGATIMTASTANERNDSDTLIRLKVNEQVYEGTIDPAQHIRLTPQPQ